MRKPERFYWLHIVTAEGETNGRTWRLKKNAIRRAKSVARDIPEVRVIHVMVNDPWGGASVAEFYGKAWPTSEVAS